MKIILKGNPLSTNHIYRHKGNMVYMTAEGKQRKQDYWLEARGQWIGKPTADKVNVVMWLYFGDKRKHDVDNYNKLVLDALTGVVWDDDEQIHSLTVDKCYSKENPRIEMEVY